MAPWAGRIRRGRFGFGGVDHEMPLNLPPHSAHGTGFVSPWQIESRYADRVAMVMEFDDPWPFDGRLRQTLEATADGLTMTLSVEADEDMPAMVGWHPWFRRFLDGPDGSPVEARLDFGTPSMYELDGEQIPTGRLIPRPDGPWDNCFTGLEGDPTITWPGVLSIELSSSCDHWVVYTEPADALCVEPQSAAPDEFNRTPAVVPAGGRLEHRFDIRLI